MAKHESLHSACIASFKERWFVVVGKLYQMFAACEKLGTTHETLDMRNFPKAPLHDKLGAKNLATAKFPDV